MELSKECWLQCYLDDSRMIQSRTMLHKCGPSCYKYSKDGTRICRHGVYHSTSFDVEVEGKSILDSADSSAAGRALADAATATGRAQQQKPKRIRREGRALNNLISIIEDDVQGQRGRLELIREHPC